MSALLYVPYTCAFDVASQPNEVISAYLKLDSEGGILKEDMRQAMKDMYPDLGEVHYSERTSVIYLITGCHVISTKYTKAAATVTVEYNIIGEVEDHKVFTPTARTEWVDIGLRLINGEWRIATDLWHHIYWKSFITHLRDEQKRLDKMRPQIGSHYRPDEYADLINNITRSAHKQRDGGE